MIKNDFQQLFLHALTTAAENAEKKIAHPISRSFLIELHAPDSQGLRVSVDEALSQLYLGNDRFYKIIDVGVKELLPRKTIVFVRVSGHQPTGYDGTWDPSGAGPFKQIVAAELEDPKA